LGATTKEVVRDCGALIQEAVNRSHGKYDDSLSPGGSANPIRDVGRRVPLRVEWHFTEQERVKEFQQKLSQGTQRLALLSALAAR
jgi:hypothetical protein